MKLEQQVVSLSLAKRLKELGVKQEALWQWVKLSMNDEPERWGLVFFGELAKPTGDETCAAFTVAELGEMLPEDIDTPDDKTEYWDGGQYSFVQTKYAVMYGRYGTEIVPDALCFDTENITEAEARGLMLAHLLENKLMTV